MGKKGGNKGKLNSSVENAEPSLPVIVEEEHQSVQIKPSKTFSTRSLKSGTSLIKNKSILKTGSKSDARYSEGTGDKSTTFVLEKRDDPPSAHSVHIQVSVEEKGRTEKKKSNKAKKGKKEVLADGQDEGKPTKGKKEKKKKTEGKDEEIKVKKDKSVTIVEEEIKSEAALVEKVRSEKSTEGITAKKDKTEKKDKGRGKKKEKVAKETKGTQKDAGDGKEESDGDMKYRKSKSKLSRHSKVSFHSKPDLQDRTKSLTDGGDRSKMIYQDDEKRHKESRMISRGSVRGDHSLDRFASTSRLRHHSIRASTSALSTEAHARRLKRWASSRLSNDTDFSSTSSSESGRLERDERGKKKKGKKGKKDRKHKGEKTEHKKEDAAKADREQKKAEKKAQKEAKKAEKLAAKSEVAALPKKVKSEKSGEMEHEDVRKKLEELKNIAREMGIDVAHVDEDEEKGPKKKVSKKEKARLTAEMAEKQKAELEAQAKRMEELIKKKREEERLAAIEKDKKDTLEQATRMEQLKASEVLIQDIVDTNAEITRKEKDLLEWQKYVECGDLPNPTMCDQMNTYLHLWELVLERTSMDVATNMTKNAIKLLNDLDELIDTVLEEEKNKLENWKWVRQLFREYQASSLDVATYRLLRDVEHNLNRINIPTADFNFKDDHVTLCVWLRVMLPIPLPNPRRPPKPRIDIFFKLMDVSVLFPFTIDCQDAAIRAMYLKYDHLSDLSTTFEMPEVPEDYQMDLLSITKKEWRVKLKYMYENRDKKPKQAPLQEAQQDGASSPENMDNPETQEKLEDDKKIVEDDEPEDFASDEEIPTVPFKQLKPTANEYAIDIEDQLYNDTRAKLSIDVAENIINLRKFVILGGVYHLNLLAQPPQPQDFITMEMTITGLYLPKKLEVLPFKVVYTPYVPPEPEPVSSTASVPRKLPEEIEEEMKRQDEELDKLISINIKWPQHVIFLELPIVCRWDEEAKQWSKEEIHDLKHNEEKCILSFRTGVFGIYGLAAFRYANLPFQAYDIKPELDESVTVQLTAAILMLEFNIKDGLICITQLQNSPNMTLQDAVGKYFKLHQLKRMMKEAGIDVFPAFDAFCYVDGCCEKQWAMEKQLYYNMAQMSNSFNFSWSRWNLQAGRRKIVLQMRQYSAENKKQKNHQMLLITPLKATFIECTEVSQTFSDKEMESLKFCADLYHLMKTSSGIFVRNKVMKASKQNAYTLAQFLISIRILSFS